MAAVKNFYNKCMGLILVIVIGMYASSCRNNDEYNIKEIAAPSLWYGWNKYQIKPKDTLVRLGHDLIENTSYYFGPKGKIASNTNGMNCQNCHIDGGIIPWGNNFSAVVISYPRFGYRSNAMMSVSLRVNDCFERSLNGEPIDSNSYEMKAIIAYMHWLGDDVAKDKKPLGAGIIELPFLNRAADTVRGQKVYINICQRCHADRGQGQPNADVSGYIYPPLWGSHSYNKGAGLYRISYFAGFVKNNMPLKEATFEHPLLTNEEAWDVAAFVNSQQRPINKSKNDYPDVSKKPFDYPFGPYADSFSEGQHKFGPFKPIKEVQEKMQKENKH